MHTLAVVKMRTDYSQSSLVRSIENVKKCVAKKRTNIRLVQPPPLAKTMYRRNGNDKWLFNDAALDGILDLKYAISQLPDLRDRELLKITLASILLDVSNVFRNGKALSYRERRGTERRIRRAEVHRQFFDRLESVFLPDVREIEAKSGGMSNAEFCHLCDVRKGIGEIPDRSIDLVITSPPYLNSRDYTDSYIVELWLLDFVKNYEELRQLRTRTLHSHVQVKIGEKHYPRLKKLEEIIASMESISEQFWNTQLLNMVKGYFADMDLLMAQLALKMKEKSRLYCNVANSAYYGIEIPVDELIGEIAESKGFRVVEIREARRIRPSSQQNAIIGSLRESVVVIESCGN
ncbi:MAG: hypothetical protein KF749_08710 [Bacteroidetes bacterium]|nr:hypothetical protein [Bacteroidota bacterium]MCW5895913.1 hypothetical protein [Bacteroidota bacterium]